MSWDPVYRLVQTNSARPRNNLRRARQRAAHLRGGARVVGYAMAATPRGRGIPWHRVVGAGGKAPHSRALRQPAAQAARNAKACEIEGARIDYEAIRLVAAIARKKRAHKSRKTPRADKLARRFAPARATVV